MDWFGSRWLSSDGERLHVRSESGSRYKRWRWRTVLPSFSARFHSGELETRTLLPRRTFFRLPKHSRNTGNYHIRQKLSLEWSQVDKRTPRWIRERPSPECVLVCGHPLPPPPSPGGGGGGGALAIAASRPLWRPRAHSRLWRPPTSHAHFAPPKARSATDVWLFIIAFKLCLRGILNMWTLQ